MQFSDVSHHLLLVNENDEVVGTGEKLWVHQNALLHRAFSILIFNSKGQMLIQRRAKTKYHSGGLWTNACCSHQLVGNDGPEILEFKLQEEIGLQTPLTFKHKFIYKTTFDNGLTEHELDHVYLGTTDQTPVLNFDEADAYTYLDVKDLYSQIAATPQQFTVWFRLILEQMKAELVS